MWSRHHLLLGSQLLRKISVSHTMKSCKNCSTANPTDFYETQSTSYCKTCFKSKYFAPGRIRLLAAKLERGECKDCGLKVTPENASVFDFDHVQDKKRTVSNMTTAPTKTFEEEIGKCELCCSNCHRLRTKSRGRTWMSPGRPRKVMPMSSEDSHDPHDTQSTP